MDPVDQGADTLDASAAGDGEARVTASGDLVAGRYRILQLIGSGGMGSVYRALDTQLEEVVALKTLKRERSFSADALERFRREIKLARKVTHRGVARAFDIGEHEGEPFLTMEHVDGRSLGVVIAQGALPLQEIVRIGHAIAEALSAAHEAGVVHRDLKPDNVLLAQDGRVVLTDFGIARALDASDAGATGAGMIVGTPAYMAPEQVDGTEIDARTDLYALGIVLFEMATRTLPFDGSSPLAMASARLVRAPADLRVLAPNLPVSFIELVQALLARERAVRPASAALVSAALAALRLMPVATPTPLAEPQAVPQVRERRLAVMRLRGPSGDDAWIADGFSEDLVDSLSTIRGLRVRGLRPAGEPRLEARVFGQREGVDVVVDGSVRREGDLVRVSLRLASVDDGFQVWAQRFESTLGDLLGVSDGAAHAIAKALAGAEHETPPERRPAGEVVELLLRSRVEASKFGMSNALELMERALVLAPDDPTVLSAFATLAAAEAFRPDRAQTEITIERGRVACERALELAPHLPEPYVARARIQVARDDRLGATRTLLAGRAKGPSFAEIDDGLGRILFEADRVDQARAHLERALWIDRGMYFALTDLARLEAMCGDRARSVSHLDALSTQSAPFHTLQAARLAAWWRRPELANGLRPPPFPGPETYFALMLAVARGEPLPEALIAAHEENVASVPPVSRPARLHLQCLAEALAMTGQTERALAAVRRSVDAGLTDLAWLRRCPAIETLRGSSELEAAIDVVADRARPVLEAYDAGA